MNARYSALLLTYVLFSACDGSTSFSGNPGSPPPAGGGGKLTITSANAMSAAGVSVRAAFQAGAIGDVVGALGVGTANVGNMNKVSGGRYYSGNLFFAAQNVPVGPIDQPCLVSGIFRISGDLADPVSGTIAAGDTLTVEALDCVDVPGETVNGRIDYSFTAINGDILVGPPFVLSVDIVLTNFQVETSADIVTSNGSASVTMDTMSDPDWSVTISGPSLTTDTTTSSTTVSDFGMAQTVNTGVVPSPYTMVTNGMVDSTELNGTVDYSTPVMFEGSGEAYPHAGEFLIVGASNASIRLIALDEINVRLESDFDGDGAVDDTTDTTWDALINP